MMSRHQLDVSAPVSKNSMKLVYQLDVSAPVSKKLHEASLMIFERQSFVKHWIMQM